MHSNFTLRGSSHTREITVASITAAVYLKMHRYNENV